MAGGAAIAAGYALAAKAGASPGDPQAALDAAVVLPIGGDRLGPIASRQSMGGVTFVWWPASCLGDQRRQNVGHVFATMPVGGSGTSPAFLRALLATPCQRGRGRFPATCRGGRRRLPCK